MDFTVEGGVTILRRNDKFRPEAHWSRMKSICSEIIFTSERHQLYIDWVHNHQKK